MADGRCGIPVSECLSIRVLMTVTAAGVDLEPAVASASAIATKSESERSLRASYNYLGTHAR